jgi:hypothetical protein
MRPIVPGPAAAAGSVQAGPFRAPRAALEVAYNQSRMLGVGTEIVVVLLLLVANGVFAMSEISIVAARKVRLQQRADDGDKRAAVALALAHAPSQFLSTVQVGISLVGVLAGAYGGATIAEPLQVTFEGIPLIAPTRAVCRSASSSPSSPISRSSSASSCRSASA